jgi:Ca-activated chloride channel family protein
MSFQWPLALVGLVLVPLLVALYLLHDRRRTAYAARFGNPALLPNVVDSRPGWRRHLPLALLLVALAAMIVGVARPHATVSVRRQEATVILALDVSRSMRATDVRPTRLAAARAAAKAFLRKVPERYRVAVIAFGSRAVLAVPPTQDREVVEDAIDKVRPSEGTALGDAVALAARMAQRQRRGDGSIPPAAMLLISDGAQNGGSTSPQAAARRAKATRMPVYAALVGTQAGVVRVTLPGGFRAIVRVPPRPDTLRMVARTTGGELFTAPSDRRLREVYEKLGSRLGRHRETREVTDLFAGGSAALLLAGGALSALWFRRLP